MAVSYQRMDNGYRKKNIHSRIAIGTNIFMNNERLFTVKLNVELKKRIIKCLVWSVALYAAETWTLMQPDRSKLEAFEVWIWRRMEKMMDVKTTEEILNVVQENRKMLNTIWCCKHKWMGHVLRHDGLLRDVLEGRMLGKRTRGRRRIQLIDDLLEKKNYTDLKKTAEDSSVWRTIRRDCYKPA